LPTLPQTAHPSKKDWSKENCDSVANLNRFTLLHISVGHSNDVFIRSFLMKDSCPCWDGKFKGTYSLDKKNVMFNVDAETLGIFAVTVMFTCVTYSGFQKIVHLIVEGSLKYSALIPVAANVHGDDVFHIANISHFLCLKILFYRLRRCVLSLVGLFYLHE